MSSSTTSRRACNPKSIRGILFDYGDTLVSKRDGTIVLEEILTDLDYEVDSREISKGLMAFNQHWEKRYKDLPRGRRWTEEIRVDCDRASLRALGLEENLNALARKVARRWPSYESLGLFNDVKPTLRVLKKMRLKLGIVSQNLWTGKQLRSEIKAYGIAGYFRIIITSEDTGYDKPDSRLFKEASKLMGFERSDLWYVGNSYENDVLGARSAGIEAVLVDRQRTHRSRHCLVIGSLLELPAILKEDRVDSVGLF